MRKAVLCFLVSLIILSMHVYAIGLSPAKVEVPFSPNFMENFSMALTNTGQYRINASLGFSGKYAKYIHFEKEYVVLGPNDIHDFHYQLILPASVDDPGDHTIWIEATDKPITTPGGEGLGISGLTSIKAMLTVKVPYPGKYLETGLLVDNANVGELVNYKIVMHNRGDQVIEKAFGELTITDLEKNEVKNRITKSISVASNEQLELQDSFETIGLISGFYNVSSIVKYDGFFSDVQTAQFRLGEYGINLTDITKNLVPNKINELGVGIESLWNKEIDSVFVDVMLTKNEKSVSDLGTSHKVLLGPFEKQDLSVFLSVPEIEEGSYELRITLHYGEKSEVLTVPVNVTKEKGFELDWTYILIAVIVLLVIFDIIKFIGKKRSKESSLSNQRGYNLMKERNTGRWSNEVWKRR